MARRPDFTPKTRAQIAYYMQLKRRFRQQPDPFASLITTLLSGAAQLIAHPLKYGSMFQDRAGTTPVTAPGQLVGRVLDVGGGNYHATAVSDAARGFFAVVPETGRRNLLERTEEFDNAYWAKIRGGTGTTPVVTANAAIAPNGSATADRIQCSVSSGSTTGSDFSLVRKSLGVTGETSGTAAVNHKYSVHLRSNTGANQQVTLSYAESTAVITVTPEWQRFDVFPRIGGGGFAEADIGVRGSSDAGAPNQPIDVLAWGAQLEVGTTATPYQRVGTQFDVTEAGVRSLSYVAYNGVNTAYQTPVLPAPGVDKAQVFAGVRRLADDTIRSIVEFGSSAFSSDGSFAIYGPTGGNTISGVASRGTATVTALSSTGPSPVSTVIVGLCDISGDLATLRFNGAQAAQSTADQGTGNYNPDGTYPLYYGARGGTSLFFNGHHYGTLGPITRFGTNATADQIAAAEAYYTTETGL